MSNFVSADRLCDVEEWSDDWAVSAIDHKLSQIREYCETNGVSANDLNIIFDCGLAAHANFMRHVRPEEVEQC